VKGSLSSQQDICEIFIPDDTIEGNDIGACEDGCDRSSWRVLQLAREVHVIKQRLRVSAEGGTIEAKSYVFATRRVIRHVRLFRGHHHLLALRSLLRLSFFSFLFLSFSLFLFLFSSLSSSANTLVISPLASDDHTPPASVSPIPLYRNGGTSTRMERGDTQPS